MRNRAQGLSLIKRPSRSRISVSVIVLLSFSTACGLSLSALIVVSNDYLLPILELKLNDIVEAV